VTASPNRNCSGAKLAIILCSITGLIWLLTARALGPSDLWDQTQPKTVSYTTDIIVHGGWHWLLPVERGELPATKPPMYNWIAVPAVRVLGFGSEIAHKLPSVVALLMCWLMVVRLGRTLDAATGADESLGWLAGLIFLACSSTFKLGFLARPDMLLTLWLLLAWRSATRASLGHASLTNALIFWLAIGCAGLTKGPAALVGIAHAVLSMRIVGGRWGTIRNLRPLIGVTIPLLFCGAWALAVWKINPEHLRSELWFNEIWGRVTGTGAEGTHHGQRQWLRELPYQGAYYMTRFAPWSFITLAALGTLVYTSLSRGKQQPGPVVGASGRSRPLASPSLRTWVVSATLFALITVGLFTLSIGKRADYIAIAFPQASLLAAWWMLRSPPHISVRCPWLVPITAAIVLGACTWHEFRAPTAPVPGFGEAIMRFATQANAAIAADPAQVYTVGAGQTHLQAMMGIADPDARHDMAEIVERSGARGFWVLGGWLQNPPHEFDRWLAQRRLKADAVAVVRSAMLPSAEGWQRQVTLWRVKPRVAGER
jgi:4-amino-4-deoxy-L-arabinose transferase-like glycosyltransferase